MEWGCQAIPRISGVGIGPNPPFKGMDLVHTYIPRNRMIGPIPQPCAQCIRCSFPFRRSTCISWLLAHPSNSLVNCHTKKVSQRAPVAKWQAKRLWQTSNARGFCCSDTILPPAHESSWGLSYLCLLMKYTSWQLHISQAAVASGSRCSGVLVWPAACFLLLV